LISRTYQNQELLAFVLLILIKDILAERASQERRTTTALEIRQGEVFRNSMNRVDVLVKKIAGK